MHIFGRDIHIAWIVLTLLLAYQAVSAMEWSKADVVDLVAYATSHYITPLLFSINLTVFSALAGFVGAAYLIYGARHIVVNAADRHIPLFGAVRQLILWSLSPWRYWAVGLTLLTFASLLLCIVYYSYSLIKRGSVKVLARVPFVHTGEQYVESEVREADDGKVVFVARPGGVEEAEPGWLARNIDWISSTSLFISAVIILQAAALTSSWIRGLTYIASIVPRQRIVTEILEAFRGFSDYVSTTHPTWSGLSEAERTTAVRLMMEWARDGSRPLETMHVEVDDLIPVMNRITNEEIDIIGQLVHLPANNTERKTRIAICVITARCPKNLAFLKNTKTIWLAAGVLAVFALAVWYLRAKAAKPFEASRRYSKTAARAMLRPREDFVEYNRARKVRADDLNQPASPASHRRDPVPDGTWADDDGELRDLPSWMTEGSVQVVPQTPAQKAAAAAAGDVAPLTITDAVPRNVVAKVSKVAAGDGSDLIKRLDPVKTTSKKTAAAASSKAAAAKQRVKFAAGGRKPGRESAVRGSISVTQRTESVWFDATSAAGDEVQFRVQVWTWNGYLVAPVTHHLSHATANKVHGLEDIGGGNYSGKVKWTIGGAPVVLPTFAYHYKFGIPGHEFKDTCMIARCGSEFNSLFAKRGLVFHPISFSSVRDHGGVVLSWHDGQNHCASTGIRWGIKDGITVQASSEDGSCGGIYYASDGAITTPIGFHVFDASQSQQFCVRVVDLGLAEHQKAFDAFFAQGRMRSSSAGSQSLAGAAPRP